MRLSGRRQDAWLMSLVLAIFFTFPCLGLFIGCVAETQGKRFEDFDPNMFSNPTRIDNKWMPLKPGTRYVYEGTTIEADGKTVPHQVVINVTDMTKVIGGVPAVVTWDLDYREGKMVEAELAFFAQDDEGNVWRMGEYPQEYKDGKFVASQTWIHGFEGARAGIMMMAKPQTGTPSYSQGWGPAVAWRDRGQVDQMNQEITVPAGSYKYVLVIAETSASENDDVQELKWYAPGVGNVRVSWRGKGDKTKEFLELTRFDHLDASHVAKIREEALKLEKIAYVVSKNVYAHTPALEHASAFAQKTHKFATTAQYTAKALKITEAEAVEIALKFLPGDVTGVTIEKKLGANRYVVELIAKEDGVETDVIIDMTTGRVLGTEK